MTRRRRKQIRKQKITHAAKPKLVRGNKEPAERNPRFVNYLAEEHLEF